MPNRTKQFLKFSLDIVSGPEKWPELFPMASGHRQSPVNISREHSTRGSTLKQPLSWKYVPGNAKSLVNPGYSWRVDVNGNGSMLTGGPLNQDIFQLEQFHCHWGCSDGKGSEHTVDGLSYSGELHLVHWNTTKYTTFDEAAKHHDGLAVLGVFLKVRLNRIFLLQCVFICNASSLNELCINYYFRMNSFRLANITMNCTRYLNCYLLSHTKAIE